MNPMILSPTLNNLLRRIEVENEAEPIWIVGPETGRMLHWLIRVTEPERVLEIGTCVGYSALWMASALEKNKKGKLWTVESNAKRQVRAEQNIAESGLRERIELVKGHAPEIFEEAGLLPSKIDFAFFDATKSEHQSFFDGIFPKMTSGGMIVVDNVLSHRFGEMEQFIQGMHEHPGLEVVEIPVGTGLLIAKVT
jgi:predicted O-methyltransferase YrrM